MKRRYDQEDDTLMIWFSRKPVDYAEQSHDMIVHFAKDNTPVLLEILHASGFLQDSYKVLPPEVRASLTT